MLLQLREYIRREKCVSMAQLVREFKTDELAIEPMLAYLLEKKMLLKEESPGCAGKACCRSGKQVYFRGA